MIGEMETKITKEREVVPSLQFAPAEFKESIL